MFIEKTFIIKAMRRKRRVTIYVPDQYKSSHKKYPVLYINDGQNAFFDETSFMGVSWGFYDFVKASGLEVIMVAIPCNPKGNKRVDEYGPWVVDQEMTKLETGSSKPMGGEGDLYLDFIVHQLKPYIDAHFPTLVEDTAIVGSSMGGIISLYATLKYPEIFNKCAALSSALWFYPHQLSALIEKTDFSKVKCIYMDLGGNEGNGNDEVSKLYIDSNDYISDLLYEKTDALYFEFFPEEGHSEVAWRKRVSIFMNAFYNLEKKQ